LLPVRKGIRVLTEQSLIKESTEMTNVMMEDPKGSPRSLMQDSSKKARAHLISIVFPEIEILKQTDLQIPNLALNASLQLLYMQVLQE
jgi:hypothetical protein